MVLSPGRSSGSVRGACRRACAERPGSRVAHSDLFEGFVKKIADQVQASPYARDTAIFITFDEGGRYYDSGYVQPVDFFDDGTPIPLIVVSAYNRPAHIRHEHTNYDGLLMSGTERLDARALVREAIDRVLAEWSGR